MTQILFTEKLTIYRVRIREGIVEVDPNACRPRQ